MTYYPIRNSGQLCPRAVRFQSCAPPLDLRECVQEFWQYDVVRGFDLVPIQVFPSGCVVIRFDIGPEGVESVLYPPSSSPQMKSVFRQGVSAFGVALDVGRAFPVLGCGIPELGPTRTPLDAVWSRSLDSLEERLFSANGFQERVDALAGALRKALRASVGAIRDVRRPLDWMLDSVGAKNSRPSDRTVRRRFDRYVGHSPKQLHRIVRVQSAMRRLVGPPVLLAELAHESGFSDQPHLNREFSSLLGMTPGFFRDSLGHFHEPDLRIWADVPLLRELEVVPASGGAS